jgi:hypothetical protein
LREFYLPMYLVLDISTLLEFVREKACVHQTVVVLTRQISATHTYDL